MSTLHAYFALRNQQAFQRTLEGLRGSGSISHQASTSAGKAPNTATRGTPLSVVEVNSRDWLGRTVLHLACASTEPSAIEYVRMLLSHPAININLQDSESHWTALHRALYNGHIAAAILLLQRAEIDTSLKDLEGYTAFDLYNATVEGTKPPAVVRPLGDLFTWGANRNATLGVGDANDRTYPEQIIIRRSVNTSEGSPLHLRERLNPIRFSHISMSKLHTAAITDENPQNIRVCGFGSGGRLGPSGHTQYCLVAFSMLPNKVIATALGQDHSLALLSTGEVYSWGLNRFSQLGYALDPPSSVGSTNLEDIQSTPKRVFGPLKKEIVRGVAACKTASACWTDTQLFTWGTNAGQLGYDSAAQPIQILPRVVAKITQPVLGIALTESAMACLLENQEVVCFWNDRHSKVVFPPQSFPVDVKQFHPKPVKIIKITSSEGTIAALSSGGEVFTFVPPPPSAIVANGPSIKPQRVWALRRQFSAVRDVALGSDGGLAICTESGHVYVRARAPKGNASAGKAFRFTRMPLLQRISAVSANGAGAFAALRVEHVPSQIKVVGNSFAEDMEEILPFLRLPSVEAPLGVTPSGDDVVSYDDFDPDDEMEDDHIRKDINTLRKVGEVIRRARQAKEETPSCSLFNISDLAHGADIFIRADKGLEFPVHRLILATRSPVLRDILSGNYVHTVPIIRLETAPHGLPILSLGKTKAMTVLILCVYLYSDELPALWDRRVFSTLERDLAGLGVMPTTIKDELKQLALVLQLPRLTTALEPHVKRAPELSLSQDVFSLFTTAQGKTVTSLTPDVILELNDRQVYAHSTILRARCAFFAAFFDDPDWTVMRWTPERTITVDLKHLRWRSMQFVLRFIYQGSGEDMFETLDFINSIDELLEFMFEVKAAANELLLENLMLICSRVIMQHINIHNACLVLVEASYLHSWALIDHIQDYLSINLETMLESHFLDDLTPDLVKQLSKFVRQRQLEKAPITRSTKLYDVAFDKFETWLSLQDIPRPIVPSIKHGPFRDSPRISPPTPLKRTAPSSPVVQRPRAELPTNRVQTTSSGDDIFAMDEPTSSLGASPPKPGGLGGSWKIIGTSKRADLKSIIAEAEGSRSSEIRGVVLPGSPRLPSTPKTPQKEWRKPSLQSLPSSGDVITTQRSSSHSSPWQIPAVPTTNAPNLGPSLQHGGSLGTPPNPVRPPLHPIASPAHESTSPRKPTNSSSGLGPVITPLRLPSTTKSEPSQRRVMSASNKAWTPVPVQPSLQPSTSTATQSFADIQAMQIQQNILPGVDKRSLREIQEEERAQQAEADFLKWWAEEEERVRREAEADAAAIAAATSGGRDKRSKKPKSKVKHSDGGDRSTINEGSPQSLKHSSLAPSGSGSTRGKGKGRGSGRGGRGARPPVSPSMQTGENIPRPNEHRPSDVGARPVQAT